MAEGGLGNCTEEDDGDLQIASQDFKKLKDTQMKAGFVEGAAAGKDKCFQAGFNEGFTRGVVSALRWGMLKGKISALQTYCTSLGLSEKARQFSVLLSEVSEAEKEWRETLDQLEQYKQAVGHQSFDSTMSQVPAVLPPVVAADTPLSEVVETAPPAPATLAELEKKLAELKVNLQLS